MLFIIMVCLIVEFTPSDSESLRAGVDVDVTASNTSDSSQVNSGVRRAMF
jgi:hypothetical protein